MSTAALREWTVAVAVPTSVQNVAFAPDATTDATFYTA
jgi:hypothetical protein